MNREPGDWTDWALRHTGASALGQVNLIQNLWGGYGELLRISLRDGPALSVILKHVHHPPVQETDSDRRKHRSYQVEQAWYQNGSKKCHSDCRVAKCLAAEEYSTGSLLLLEDLGNAGFHPSRPPSATQVLAGLRWLANFHSLFLLSSVPGLWEQGTYWHLETRQQEWCRMPESPWKDNAGALDQALRGARFQTLVHGDAKPSNFCWGPGLTAAAVDFQYVGPGCGIRDVAYFLDCCLDEHGCQTREEEMLSFYFAELRQAMRRDGHAGLQAEVEAEWRSLFPVAWSDFQRFYQGWGRPGPPGDYSRHLLNLALRQNP